MPRNKSQFKGWIVSVFAIITLIVIVIGFQIDEKDFLGNLLAEIFGITAGALVLLLLIERFNRYQRQKRWERTRKSTYDAVAIHLIDVISDAVSYFLIEELELVSKIAKGRREPSRDTIIAINNLISQLKKINSEDYLYNNVAKQIIGYHESIKWDIDQIRNILIPRVIQSSEDQELIDILIEFDNMSREFRGTLTIYERLLSYKTGSLYYAYLKESTLLPAMISMIEKARDVYEVMLKSWK